MLDNATLEVPCYSSVPSSKQRKPLGGVEQKHVQFQIYQRNKSPGPQTLFPRGPPSTRGIFRKERERD
ncbi:hypothetical protein E2C01_070929 [Portunus trituberculatus]|uniref:Uncharacterized protein n=1 Tax=Portunus trituberculatus TaxID=210409 RepID=A0A5B7I2N6_PORTR|nr:hypothetical protein [Portunus trituberculatus]